MEPSEETAQNAAAHYDQFFGPLFFEPYAIEVANRIDPAHLSIVLEVAAGTGRVTHHLRKRMPAGARLIATDISESMMEEAKKKLGGLAIEWQQMDAQDLKFNDNSIDLVVCCFGYIFVADKAAAFAEAYRVLETGGSILFTTWDALEENGASYTSMLIAEEYLDGPIPPSLLLATSMHDESMIQELVASAGFKNIKTEKVRLASLCASAHEAAEGFIKGNTVFKDLAKNQPAIMKEIKSRLELALSEKFGALPMVAPISAVICQAWK